MSPLIKMLKDHNRFYESVFLAILTAECVIFSIFRLLYTQTEIIFSLNWNLFLAFIPYLLSSLITINSEKQSNKFIIFVLLFFWFFFFPNAPYILTDLFHLQDKMNMPVWFDLILILSYAWTGLLFGLLSLWDIEKLLRKYFSENWVKFIVISLLFIGSFGIYLGRFLRWNSWDLIKTPLSLFYDIGGVLIDPDDYPRAWGVTIFMGIFLNMIYWSFRFIQKRNN